MDGILENATENDVLISSILPKKLPESIQPFVEYRIKLFSKHDYTIHTGETRNIETSLVINKKIGNLCLHLKQSEFLPLIFESEGFVHPRFEGRIIPSISNHTTKDMQIPRATIIGYAVLQPYSVK